MCNTIHFGKHKNINLDGYYDDIKHFLQHMIDKGLSDNEKQRGVYFAESLEEI